LRIDFKEFENIETLSIPIEQAREKITELQIKLSSIGTINLKALEVYDKVKESCESIEQRMKTIEDEKQKILNIIQEIDKKKKKTFMKTLEALNILFTRNFSQLSKKGEVFLDLENKEDPFAGGLNIIVKVGRGKYFDVTSLSGGEKTLVSLSLIFAIQEYKPYCFYVFDEIDAALDKHNSELLAALIKKYMTSGQYIVVTHNDALISEATNLFGVSMQEGISKVISLKI
jgi:chromosome segregation protein